VGSFSDFLELELLDHVFGAAAYTAPGTIHIAAFTATPSDSGGGTEVTGGSYARVAVTNNSTNFPAASAGAKANGTAITFPEATASWGSVAAISAQDAAAAGNQLGWDDFTAKAIGIGDTLNIAAGDLDITLD
jgi:hypothetical protein